MCLSCHDGTVAIDSFGGNTGTAGTLDAEHSVGMDLSNDHPIGFVYNTALATLDGALHDPANIEVTIGSSPTKTGTIQNTLLYDDKLECSSCHDVHNTFTANGSGDEEMLLKVTQTGSAMCLACHNK